MVVVLNVVVVVCMFLLSCTSFCLYLCELSVFASNTLSLLTIYVSLCNRSACICGCFASLCINLHPRSDFMFPHCHLACLWSFCGNFD